MNPTLVSLFLSLALLMGASPSSLRAGEPSGDPLGSLRFAPTLALEQAAEIGLTPEQRRRIEDCLLTAQEQYPVLQEVLLAEMDKLAALQQTAKVDESAARERFISVLEKENAIKLLQFTLLNQVRNILDPAQVEQLRRIQHGRSVAGGAGGNLSAQIEAVQRQIEQARAAGAPPEQIRQMSAQLQKLVAADSTGGGGATLRVQIETVRSQIEQARAAGAPPEQIQQMEAQLRKLMDAAVPGESGARNRPGPEPN